MSDPVKQIAMRILDLREISDYTVQQMAVHSAYRRGIPEV